MKFLKGLGLSLLGFLLFLSISTFSFAYLLNNTLLNPDFATTQLNRLDMSSLAEEFLAQQPADETNEALVNVITELEPTIKEQLGVAINDIYDYVLGKSQSLDLALTLRNSVLSTDFAVSVMDKLDLATLVGENLKEQFAQEIPPEMMGYLEEPLDDTLKELEPWMKEQIGVAADPMLDYLLGRSPGFSVEISLEPVLASLQDNLREAFQENMPPEFAVIPPAMFDQYFDQFYQQFTQDIPATVAIDQSLFGAEMPMQITQMLTDAEVMLAEGRQYVSYFQQGYNLLIGLILLLILGIVLIHREVKGASRQIGTTLATFGAIEYISILVAKYFGVDQLTALPIPASLQAWLAEFVNDLLAPLEVFSLVCLISGAVLIIVSFVYPRLRPGQPVPEIVPEITPDPEPEPEDSYPPEG